MKGVKKTKQKPLFGVTEYYGDGVKNNYISQIYIEEERGEFTRILHPRNRLSSRILDKMRQTKGRSKKQGTRLLHEQKKQEEIRCHKEGKSKKSQQKQKRIAKRETEYRVAK